MPLEILRNDITQMKTDAIVNAANPALQRGGGVCGAIFAAAGAAELQQECDAIGHCDTGQAAITKGDGLYANYIIHAVGPVWRGGVHNEAELLASSYTSSLRLALEHGLASIAFPLISSGIYGYPRDAALQIAISAIGRFLLEHEMMVYLVVFDRESYSLNKNLSAAIRQYVDERYVEQHTLPRRAKLLQAEESLSEILADVSYTPLASQKPAFAEAAMQRSLGDIVNRLDESFSQMLLRLIDEKGTTDVETYKRANIDRKLFSKIRTGKGYTPRKPTAMALAIGLRLNLDETRDLLARAGYALSHSYKLDIIVEYFITEGNYNIFEINEALFAFEQPLLGGG